MMGVVLLPPYEVDEVLGNPKIPSLVWLGHRRPHPGLYILGREHHREDLILSLSKFRTLSWPFSFWTMSSTSP